jgi:radical SAM superfamily enzyme
MSEKELKGQIKEMREFTKKLAASKDRAIRFLAGTGMYTPKGNLKKMFQ